MAKEEIFEETRPTNDAWTGMLAISLVALIVACLLLFLDFSQYPSKDPGAVPKAVIPAAQAPVAAPQAPVVPPQGQPGQVQPKVDVPKK
jgi:hypothetical protein